MYKAILAVPKRPCLERDFFSVGGMRVLAFLSFVLAVSLPAVGSTGSLQSIARFQDTDRYTFLKLDMNGDSRTDYIQRLDRLKGWKDAFYLDLDFDGRFEQEVVPEEFKPDDLPHIVLATDGFPFREMVRLREQKRFLLFRNAGRMVAPYPSLSAVGWSKIMGLEKPAGYESRYFDKTRNHIEDGPESEKLPQDNEYLGDVGHARAYLQVRGYAKQELEDLLSLALKRRDQRHTVLYVLSTDAAGHRLDDQDYREILQEVDRLAERIFYEYQCRCRLTIVSDHGNNRSPGEFVNIVKPLEDAGFHRSNSIDSEKDFAIPLYGMVGVAAIYTNPRNTRLVAEVLVPLSGIRFCSWYDAEGVHLLSKQGEALVKWKRHRIRYDVLGIFSRLLDRGDDYLYKPFTKDPLELDQVIESSSSMKPLHYYSDRTWLESTWNHVYPDPLRRLRNALEDNVKNNATLLVDIEDGYYSASLVRYVARSEGTHGSLSAESSMGVVAATWCEVPQAVRSDDVNEILRIATKK